VARNGIPFLNLVTPHRELKEELVSVFEHAVETAGFIGGPMVEDTLSGSQPKAPGFPEGYLL
jgi:hypothetical protein